MSVIEREALEVVRARWRLAGLAGPSVAHAEGIIAALNEAGMLCASDSDLRGAVEIAEDAIRLAEALIGYVGPHHRAPYAKEIAGLYARLTTTGGQ